MDIGVTRSPDMDLAVASLRLLEIEYRPCPFDHDAIVYPTAAGTLVLLKGYPIGWRRSLDDLSGCAIIESRHHSAARFGGSRDQVSS